MTLDPELVSVLACPRTGERLLYIESEGLLLAPNARLVYPVPNGIPDLLAEAAREIDGDEAQRLTALLEA